MLAPEAAPEVHAFDASGDWVEAARLPSGDTTNTVYGISVDFIGGKALVSADSWPDGGRATAPRRGAARRGVGVVWRGDRELRELRGDFCDGFDSVD